MGSLQSSAHTEDLCNAQEILRPHDITYLISTQLEASMVWALRGFGVFAWLRLAELRAEYVLL